MFAVPLVTSTTANPRGWRRTYSSG